MPILKLTNIARSFGSLVVIEDISLTMEPGQALGILGPNGAGKTTLLNMISGDLPLSKGSVEFDGHDVTNTSAEKRCHMGIGRTSQIPRPLIGMTVYENVLVGATYGTGSGEKGVQESCVAVLQQTGLLDRWNVLAGDLRLLERKRLELARALATQPTLLLLDEIAGGLTDHEVHELLDIINDIRAQGITIIWIEHIVHALMAVVDRLLAIDSGVTLIEGDPETVVNSEDFKAIYFGVESVRYEGQVAG